MRKEKFKLNLLLHLKVYRKDFYVYYHCNDKFNIPSISKDFLHGDVHEAISGV